MTGMTKDDFPLLAEVFTTFQTVYMPARNLAQKTRQEYTRDVGAWLTFLETQEVERCDQVQLAHLQGFLAQLDAQGLKASTRNRKVYAIRTFFRFLKAHGHVDDNPAEPLQAPKIPKREHRYLSEQEFNKLLAQIVSVRDKAIVMLFLQVGLRLSEVVGLCRQDVELPKRITQDPENVGLLQVTRKGGKEVVLPVNWKACRALKEWLKERRRMLPFDDPKEALFLNRYGYPLSQRAIQKMLKKYLQDAGIENASVHTLRHTMATHYLANGANIRVVQEMLGHESLSTTAVYLGLAKKAQKKMVQTLAL